MKKLLWWCSWSSYKEDFDIQLRRIRDLDEEAADDLLEYPMENWSRAAFDTYCKDQTVDNKFTESFNAWILEARHKPIIKMLEDISDRHRVLLAQKKCTCRTWQLTGIPCPHAIKALQTLRQEPKELIHWLYSKEAYLRAYHHKLQPVRGEKFWKIEAADAIEPPPILSLPGRPRTKRTRQPNEAISRQGEWSQSRRGRVMTCSTCGQLDHNARTCQQGGKQPAKRNRKNNRRLEDLGGSSPTWSLPDEEDISLSAPQLSQDSGFKFMPTPTVRRSSHRMSDVGHDPDPPIRPTTIAETSRFQDMQRPATPYGLRSITFADEGARGSGASCTRVLRSRAANTKAPRQKLKVKKGNGKAQG